MNEISSERLQFLGFVGVALLVVGVFLPLIRFPVVGSETAVDWGWGYLILVVAAGAAYLIHLRQFRNLLWPVAATFAVCAVLFWRIQTFLTSILSSGDFLGHWTGYVLSKLADSFGYSWEWGWLVLVVGNLMLLAAALLKSARA
jgi:hypothetical protein